MFRRRVDCPHVHPTADPDRWVFTFGATGAGRQAIWYRPHPSSATTVVTIDLERLVDRAVASASFPVPVHVWPSTKLERFCATQFATFERPERTELEMPSLSATGPPSASVAPVAIPAPPGGDHQRPPPDEYRAPSRRPVRAGRGASRAGRFAQTPDRVSMSRLRYV